MTELSRTDQRIAAGRAAFVAVLEDQVKALKADTREIVEPSLDPGESVSAQLPDGTVIGKVSRSKPRESARVTDERLLLEWVKKNRPDEIVESVRSSYVDLLKAQAKKTGHAYDEATGEVIPGIEVIEGSPSYLPTATDEGKAIVARRLAGVLPALTGENSMDGDRDGQG